MGAKLMFFLDAVHDLLETDGYLGNFELNRDKWYSHFKETS